MERPFLVVRRGAAVLAGILACVLAGIGARGVGARVASVFARGVGRSVPCTVRFAAGDVTGLSLSLDPETLLALAPDQKVAA